MLFGVPALLCLALVSVVECDYSLSQTQEDSLVNCLLPRSHSRIGRCRKIGRLAGVYGRQDVKKQFRNLPTKVAGTQGDVSSTHPSMADAATDYLLALTEFQNSEGSRADLVRASWSLGSCGHLYSAVLRSWRHFLRRRTYGTIMLTPSWQERNGTKIMASFDATGTFGAKYAADDIKAVDFVISRSQAESSEFYGKYLITAEIEQDSSEPQVQERVRVHESFQAICPSEHRRYFVGQLNELGREDVVDWFRSGSRAIKLEVEALAKRQILRAEDGTYVEDALDTIEGLSAIMIHVKQTEDEDSLLQIVRDDMAARPRAEISRVQRDLASLKMPPVEDVATENGICHRKKYTVDYTYNERVLRPKAFDVGECVGSCDKILTLDLNATNHAMTLEAGLGQNEDGNPEPTVCCVPIAYRSLYYLTEDEMGRRMMSYAKNMVTRYCGCR